MIRHSTTRIFNGKRVSRSDAVEGTAKQKQDLLECGQAYEDVTKPDSNSLKSEIVAYLEENDIEFDSTATKAELIELI